MRPLRPHSFGRRRRAIAATATLTLVSAIGAQAITAGAAAPHPAVTAQHSTVTTSSAIQHVIVVMQSGHSFDNYFGTRRGVDGIPAGVCQRVQVNSKSCVKPYHLSSDQARAGLTDTLRVTSKALDLGKMDGFVNAQPNATIGSLAMGYFNGADLPYYWNLADRFTLYDHFFAVSQAGGLPNRLAAEAGQTTGLLANASPAGGIPVSTVFDQLNAAHLSWKYYVQGYPFQPVTAGDRSRVPLLSMPAVTGNPGDSNQIVGTGQYFSDLAAGTLPAVSYVSGSSGNSERSPQSPAQGEAFVESLVNALMQSSAWQHTALLLTYDDSGGWYDHAVPPTVGGPDLGSAGADHPGVPLRTGGVRRQSTAGHRFHTGNDRPGLPHAPAHPPDRHRRGPSEWARSASAAHLTRHPVARDPGRGAAHGLFDLPALPRRFGRRRADHRPRLPSDTARFRPDSALSSSSPDAPPGVPA